MSIAGGCFSCPRVISGRHGEASQLEIWLELQLVCASGLLARAYGEGAKRRKAEGKAMANPPPRPSSRQPIAVRH